MQATEALLIAIRAIPTILPFPLKGERNLLLDVDGQGGCILFSALKECNNQNATTDFVHLVFSLSPGGRGQG